MDTLDTYFMLKCSVSSTSQELQLDAENVQFHYSEEMVKEIGKSHEFQDAIQKVTKYYFHTDVPVEKIGYSVTKFEEYTRNGKHPKVEKDVMSSLRKVHLAAPLPYQIGRKFDEEKDVHRLKTAPPGSESDGVIKEDSYFPAVEDVHSPEFSGLVADVTDVLRSIKIPYGILLEHKFQDESIGLNGLDLVLQTAAIKLPGTVHILPVVVSTYSEEFFEDHSHNRYGSSVFPFTSVHQNFLNGFIEKTEFKIEASWLKDVKQVPFYTMGPFEETVTKWDNEEIEAFDSSYDDPQGQINRGIYLSFALLHLP